PHLPRGSRHRSESDTHLQAGTFTIRPSSRQFRLARRTRVAIDLPIARIGLSHVVTSLIRSSLGGWSSFFACHMRLTPNVKSQIDHTAKAIIGSGLSKALTRGTLPARARQPEQERDNSRQSTRAPPSTPPAVPLRRWRR